MTGARERRRHALRAALSAPSGTKTPDRPREAASAPHGAVSAHPRPVPPAAPPAPQKAATRATSTSSSPPAWDDVDRLADELAGAGDDLPADLSVDERRAAILERLRTPLPRTT